MENLEDDFNMDGTIAPSSQQVEAEVTSTSTVSENLDSSVEIIESAVELVDLTSAITPQPSTSSASNSAGAVGSSNAGGATNGSGGLIKTNLEAAFKDASTHNTESLPLDSLLDQNPSTSTTAASTSSSSATGNVLECPICLQTCIHPARLPCGHIFCFLCVKGVAYKNRRCAMCRREIPPEFLDHPQLVNGIEDICTTKATDDGYQWFYEGRNGWWQYDDRTSQDLEDSFKKGERSCTILVAGYVYIVDFDAMIQQRQNEPARCRRVKRDLATIPKKGVAGLRIEGNTVTTDSNFAAQVYQSRQNRYRAGELLNDGDLDNPNNAILRTHSSNDLSTTNPQGRLHLSYGGLGGYVIELGNPSEFVSTAAATDAALRIASDIIGSTLAHADELTRSNSNNLPSTSSSNAYAHTINNPDASSSLISSSGELSLNDLTLNSHLTATPLTATTATPTSAGITSAGTGAGGSSGGTGVNLSRERGSRELLGAAEDLLGATQRVIATADQPTIDLFQQTLNDFHALTLRDIVDSGSDEHLGTSEDLLGAATQRIMTTTDQPRIDLFQQTLNDFHALNMRNIVDSSDEDNEQEQRAPPQSQTHQQQNQQHSTSTPPGQRSSHTYNQENP